MAPYGNVVVFFRYQDSFKGLQGGGEDPLKIITERGVLEAISMVFGGLLKVFRRSF